MAVASQIAEVRENVAEPTDESWGDEEISIIIDEEGGDIFAASAIIWRRKAAKYAELIDVAEAGASHAFSQLYRSALDLAMAMDKESAKSGGAGGIGRANVKVIDRAYGI